MAKEDFIKDGWYYCGCGQTGQKLFKVRKDTHLVNHVDYCKKCKKEKIINVRNLRVIN